MITLLHRVAAAVFATAAVAAHPAPTYPVNVPPSATLHYTIRSRQSGVTIDGSGTVDWTVSGRNFVARSQANAMLLGKILEARSVGIIDRLGLEPTSFTQKRFRKDETTTTFDRATGQIRFSASSNTYPIDGAVQDRNSMVWQLVSVARAAPARFKPGSSWNFFVAGPKDADPWTFKVVGRDRISTSLGTLDAVHLQKEPPSSGGQRVDLWLAPAREWYPVRLRYTDADGDYIEQTLTQIDRRH